MDGFFFVYTMAVLLVCLLASFTQFAAAGATRKVARVALGCFFFCYFLELGSIFLEEFLHQNLAFSRHDYYEILNPWTRTAFSTLLLGSLWASVLALTDRLTLPRLLVPTGVFLALQVACVTALPYGPVRQFLYYTLRQLFMAWMVGFGWWACRRASTPEETAWLQRHKGLALLVCLGIVGIVAEDCLVILVLDPVAVSSLPLYLAERNFVENILLLALAWVTLRQAAEELEFRLRQPPAPRADGADAAFASHVDELMPRFAEAHGLTAREREVLGLLLESKTNTQMADELFLSVGTVKTHVHNIMRKTQTADRTQLRQCFWRG